MPDDVLQQIKKILPSGWEATTKENVLTVTRSKTVKVYAYVMNGSSNEPPQDRPFEFQLTFGPYLTRQEYQQRVKKAAGLAQQRDDIIIRDSQSRPRYQPGSFASI